MDRRMVETKNPGRYREVSIRIQCMDWDYVDWRTVGTKNPGRCREVAIVGRWPL